MYAKLILRSARRSGKDSLIYLVTLTLCAALFYAFLSISSAHYDPGLGLEYDLTHLSAGMKAAICSVTLLLLFLIRYVNRYMLRRKYKELGLQALLGMEQTTCAWLFFAETFLLGLAALALGIALGVFLSQGINAMLLANYGQPFRLTWTLFPDTVGLTLVFFLASFLVVGLFNVRSIRKLKVIDLLQAQRKNEESLAKSRWMGVVSVLYLLCLGGMGAMHLRLMALYYDLRYPFVPQLFYWGNLLLPLVGLGAGLSYLIRRKALSFPRFLGLLAVLAALHAGFAAAAPGVKLTYWIPLSQENLNLYLLFLLLDLVFFLCAVMYLAGRLLLRRKESSAQRKYRGEALFFYGQVLSKLTSSSKSMALIALTLVLSIFLFMAAPALIGWAEGFLQVRAQYDVQISSQYNDVISPENLPLDDFPLVSDYLQAQGIQTTADRAFQLYLPRRADFHNRMKYDFPVAALALSDYNAVRSMLGCAPITLGPGEFTTQWYVLAQAEEREAFLSQHQTLETDGGTLTLAQTPAYTDVIGETVYNSFTSLVYILPDQVAQALLPVASFRFIQTQAPLTFRQAAGLEEAFAAQYPENTQGADQGSYSLRTSTSQVNESKAACFLLETMMTYCAVVLMVICFTILSLQQLWDAEEYRFRFGILQKLGADQRAMGSLVTKQLLLWFGLPVGAAGLVGAAVVAYFLQTISGQITAYVGFAPLLCQLGAAAAVLLLLLCTYFAMTWALFRRAAGLG